jgi:uncharacterized membrane protein
VIARVIRLAIVGGLAAVAADRWLASRRPEGEPEPLRMLVVIDAPIDRVWEILADIPRQPEWMLEMKEVRMLTPGPTGVGSRGEATVRIFGISVTDPVTVTEFEPPTRFAVRHEGRFEGSGLITLEPGVDGATTIVRWEERLVPPLLPELGAVVQAPVLRQIFQEDLHRLKRLVETGSPDTVETGSPEPTGIASPDPS